MSLLSCSPIALPSTTWRNTIVGERRVSIEGRRRPTDVLLETNELGRAVVRDQSPMDDKALSRCLQDGLWPEEWYRPLNAEAYHNGRRSEGAVSALWNSPSIMLCQTLPGSLRALCA